MILIDGVLFVIFIFAAFILKFSALIDSYHSAT